MRWLLTEEPEDWDEEDPDEAWAEPLGDVVICRTRAKEQAETYGHSLLRELSFLAVHGCLHLLGYDHMTEADERVMREKQTEILDRIGVTR